MRRKFASLALVACLTGSHPADASQAPDVKPATPTSGARHAAPQTGAPQLTTVPAPTRADLQALRQDVATLLDISRAIEQATAQETFLAKVRDDFVSNFLWEIFGFKQTEKTIVGMLLSVLGILGLSFKLLMFVRRRGAQTPAWLQAFMIVYMTLAVMAFTAMTFSGGIAQEVTNPRASASEMLAAADRLTAGIDRSLASLDTRMVEISEGLSKLNARAPGVVTASSLDQPAQARLDRLQEVVQATQRDARNAAERAAEAADRASAAAARSTGWLWHLLIVGLLVAVVFWRPHQPRW